MYDLADLRMVLKKLRSKDGCPWDKKQTHKSMKGNLIEECYEVLEAIDNNNDDLLIEELGDVLFQVVFHSQIAEEEQRFSLSEVIDRVCDKMITRHPKVFLSNRDDEKVEWTDIKNKEKGYVNKYLELKHIGKNLPALFRCEKVQKKSEMIDDNIEQKLEDLKFYINQFEKEYKVKSEKEITLLIGEMLFKITEIGTSLNLQAEFALNNRIDEYIEKFKVKE